MEGCDPQRSEEFGHPRGGVVRGNPIKGKLAQDVWQGDGGTTTESGPGTGPGTMLSVWEVLPHGV